MAEGFLANSVLISVEMHAMGIRRKVASGAVQTDADKTMISVSKKLLESDAYDAILTEYGKIRSYIDAITSGPSFIRQGMRFLSLELVNRMEEYLKDRVSVVEGLVNQFIDNDYAPARADADSRLG